MEFISTEEFLKQPKGIQKVFIDWWEPSVGDLYLLSRINLLNGNGFNEVNCIRSSTLTKRIKECEDFKCILLTEGQLREFIEDKTKCKIDINVNSSTNKKYNFDFELWTLESDLTFYLKSYYIQENDLLKALWKVALEIAEESVENE